MSRRHRRRGASREAAGPGSVELLPARPDIAIAIDKAPPSGLRAPLGFIEERALVDPSGPAAIDHDLAIDQHHVHASHMSVVDDAGHRVEQGREAWISAIQEDE